MDRTFTSGMIVQHFKRQFNSEGNTYLYRIVGIANGGFADAERRNFWNRLDGDRDGTKAAWLKIQWVI